MMGENAATENVEWIFVRYALSESHAAARRSRNDLRIAQDRFSQNQHRSRSLIASVFFLYVHDKSLYRVHRETRDVRYALRDNRHTTECVSNWNTSARVLAHECTHASRITIFLIVIVLAISLNPSLGVKREWSLRFSLYSRKRYHRDYLRYLRYYHHRV